MEEKKKLLLISSILMIVYLIPNVIFTILFGLGNNIVVKWVNISLYTLSILGIVLFMIYAFSKKDINRGVEFFISIIFLLMNIISGILGFVYFKKTSTYKKRELPKLEIMQNYPKIVYILAFLLSMGLMFILPLFIKNNMLNIGIDAFICLLMAVLFIKDLKRDFKAFKEYFREYNSYVWKMFGISLGVMVVLAISIRLITGISTATNQSDLMESFKYAPLLVVFLACVFAPFMEELLFRGIFRKIFSNKWLFIILCGITFGALHVIDDFQSIKELLYILVYSSLGIFLSTVYYKTNNIFTNMYFHFIQNTLAIISMIILTFLGI